MGAACLAGEWWPRFAVDEWRLANGLRIVVQTDRRWPLVASVMSYDAGSRYDPASRSGLAHVCEHLAFYGPRSASGRTFPRRIEGAGGSAQAVTTPDRVCFTAMCPRAELAAVLAVEAERMALAFEPQSVETLEIERRVLAEELRQRAQARTGTVAIEQIHRMLFPKGHAYHRVPAGDLDAICAMTTEDVTTFLASHFVPRRAVLVLAGDVIADDAAKLVEHYFGHLPGGAERAGEPASTGEPRHIGSAMRLPAAVPGIQAHVAWSAPGFGQPAWYAASLFVRALAAGRSSALAREMIDRAGLAQAISGRIVTMRDASTLVIAATAAHGVECQRLEQGLGGAVDRLLGSCVSPLAIECARKKALRDHYMTIQKLDRRADVCASFAAHLGAPGRLEDEPRRYASADERAVAVFASELRDRPARVTLSLVPRAEAA